MRNKFSEAKIEEEKINFPTFRRDLTKKRIPQSFFIYKMKEMRNRQLEKRKFYGFHPDLHFRQTPLNLFIAAKKAENPKLCFRELLKESERWRDSEIADDLIIASQRQKELFDIENKHATRKVINAKDWIALKVIFKSKVLNYLIHFLTKNNTTCTSRIQNYNFKIIRI